MSTPLRGKCPVCGKRYRLDVQGTLYKHETAERHDGVWVLDLCSGSFGAPVPDSVRLPRFPSDAPRVHYDATKTGTVDGQAEMSLSWWDRHWPAVYAVAILVVGVGIGYTAGIRGWRW